MSERLTPEQLEACFAILESAAIRSQTEVGCGRQMAALREVEAELRSLRAECEAAKARRVPNLDAMTFQELRLFHMQLDALDGYQFARRRVLADKVDRSIEAEQWYAALPPWAKFREE